MTKMRAKKFPFDQRFALIVCLAIVIILFLPAIVFGPRKADDMSFHLIWITSYREALQHGVFYPRWMPDAIAGLGSPVFFFYPPLTTLFFLATDAVTLHTLSSIRVIGVGAFFMGVLSGTSFYTWARNFTDVRIAAIIATFYVVAPYHMLMDFYTRGALAEYAAYIWVPLIFHALHHAVISDKARWLALLACSVAGLFLTHLLTAMIVGPIAAAYAIIHFQSHAFLSKNAAARKILTVTLATLLGVGLSAVYFVPALLLLKDTSAEFLNRLPIEKTRLFQNFSLKNPFYAKLNLFAVTYIVMALYILCEYARNFRRTRCKLSWHNSKGLLFVFSVVFSGLLMAGQFAVVFSDKSPYRSLQFVWRLLAIVEFCTSSLIAIALADIVTLTSRRRICMACSVIALILVAYQTNVLIKRYYKENITGDIDFEKFRVQHRMAPPEYYAIGANFPRGDDDLAKRLEKYIARPGRATVITGDGQITHEKNDYASFTIDATASDETTIALHQFYFPGWRATDQDGTELPVTPATSDQLASFTVGPGQHTITVERHYLAPELAGFSISGAAMVLLVMLLVFVSRKKANVAGADDLLVYTYDGETIEETALDEKLVAKSGAAVDLEKK